MSRNRDSFDITRHLKPFQPPETRAAVLISEFYPGMYTACLRSDHKILDYNPLGLNDGDTNPAGQTANCIIWMTSESTNGCGVPKYYYTGGTAGLLSYTSCGPGTFGSLFVYGRRCSTWNATPTGSKTDDYVFTMNQPLFSGIGSTAAPVVVRSSAIDGFPIYACDKAGSCLSMQGVSATSGYHGDVTPGTQASWLYTWAGQSGTGYAPLISRRPPIGKVHPGTIGIYAWAGFDETISGHNLTFTPQWTLNEVIDEYPVSLPNTP